MNSGIVTVCIAPLKKEPFSKSEMVSQLLFGETFSILTQKDSWLQIVSHHDQFEAWIDEKQIKILAKKEADKLQLSNTTYSFDAFATGISKEQHLPIVLGSNLPHFDGLSFKILKEKIIYNGQVLSPNTEQIDFSLTEKICLKYLNAPSVWGGRSPFGIDAAGFTQMVYKFIGINLPRTTMEQEQKGRALSFLSEAREGDLVFTENELGYPHVGIYLPDNRVAHSFGKVKIDLIDTHGIFDKEKNSYSHLLKFVRRV